MSGGGKGGGGSDEVTQTSEPWEPAQPYLRELMSEAKKLYGQGTGSQYYPGSTYIPPSGDTLQAQQAIRQRATQGSPLLDAADSSLTATLRGDYLTAGNPGFSAMADRVAAEVMPQIAGQYGSTGRVGGSGYDEAMARGLGDALAPIAYQDYAAERQNQMRGMMMAPDLEMAGYMPAQQLGILGQQIEGYEGRQLQADLDRWNFNQTAPWDLLSRYSGAVTGMGGMGSTQTSEQPSQGGGPLGGILGGFSTAAGIGQSLGGAGWLGKLLPFLAI